MAVAPLNKFITIAVPVAPGEQTVYTAPTGVSSIVPYASAMLNVFKVDFLRPWLAKPNIST